MPPELALRHLHQLGHRKIAFMQGQPFSSDSDTRWAATLQVARELGLEVNDELTIHLSMDSHSPEISYPGIRRLIQSRPPLSPPFSASTTSRPWERIRALHEAGLRVPQDVSVLGFDDIQSSHFQVPSLTTIRQPLQKMGSTAARDAAEKTGW